MALCESQLDSVLPAINREESPGRERSQDQSPEKKPNLQNGDIYQVPGGLPLTVDYRSPVSHFVPPAVELYAARQKHEQHAAVEISATPPPVKRKRGRPRIDKTSPEYLANVAARKQAKEMAAVMNANNRTPDTGEKRKRGRPRVDKTSPEYLARKKARELEALERKAKREYKRRATGAKPIKVLPSRAMKKLPAVNRNKVVRKIPQKIGNTVRKVGDRKVLVRRTGKLIRRKDSAASSSAGENTPRVKRKYTKRTPGNKRDAAPSTERVKGKRGRPRKADQLAALSKQTHQPKIRVRSNLMPPSTAETITLDSDDEPDLGSPSQASDSLSLDENLRALRHIHEKYANIDKDDRYEAHLLAANFKKPSGDAPRRGDDALAVRSSEGAASVKHGDSRVEKLEDSSNSDSDSSTSGSGSSSSSSSSASSSSDSSDSSDSESEAGAEQPPLAAEPPPRPNTAAEDDSRSFGAWSTSGPATGSDPDSDSDPERAAEPPALGSHDEISESENESADKSFQCHICRKWFSTRVTLKIHRRVHAARGGGARRSRARSGDRYECDCCPETFNRREKLWEHRAAAHRGAMTVRCAVCRRCFEDDAELAAHDAAHSDDERAGRCSVCGAVFPRWEQLRRHKACAHGASAPAGPAPPPGSLPHACAVCGKRFGHAHSLTRHMHNHAKQLFRCVVCKASFARADQLAQHLNSHLANYKRLKP